MHVTCPTCGEVTRSRCTFNSDTGYLLNGPRAVKLTRMEVKLLCCLLEDPASFKSQEQVIRAVYDGRFPITAQNTLKVIISRFRKKLKGVNLTIQNRVMGGYRLALCDEKEAFELRYEGGNRVTQIKGVDLSSQQQ